MSEQDSERLKALIDSRDFHAELTGLEIGRIPRFFSATVEAMRNGKDANGRDKLSDLEWLMLNNPGYAAVYNRVQDRLVEANQAVDRAMTLVNERIHLAELQLKEMEDRASTLPDGTKVFKSRSGKAYTADGHELSKHEADSVNWRDDSPLWDDYHQIKNGLKKAEQEKLAIEKYQNETLEPMQARVANKEAVTKDELEDWLKKEERTRPDVVQKAFANAQNIEADIPKLQEARSIFGNTGLNAPDIRGHFDKVRVFDIPDLSAEPTTPTLSTVLKP